MFFFFFFFTSHQLVFRPSRNCSMNSFGVFSTEFSYFVGVASASSPEPGCDARVSVRHFRRFRDKLVQHSKRILDFSSVCIPVQQSNLKDVVYGTSE